MVSPFPVILAIISCIQWKMFKSSKKYLLCTQTLKGELNFKIFLWFMNIKPRNVIKVCLYAYQKLSWNFKHELECSLLSSQRFYHVDFGFLSRMSCSKISKNQNLWHNRYSCNRYYWLGSLMQSTKRDHFYLNAPGSCSQFRHQLITE